LSSAFGRSRVLGVLRAFIRDPHLDKPREPVLVDDLNEDLSEDPPLAGEHEFSVDVDVSIRRIEHPVVVLAVFLAHLVRGEQRNRHS
jgi:hypothetical protein